MKINFNSISIEGFRSIVKPLRFNLNKNGLNLIKGINGAGKTSIFEALVWAIYGINLKDTNIGAVASWSEVRPSTWQGTRVSVEFTVNDQPYTVTRHLSYKGLTHEVKGEDGLMLAKNGTLIGDYRNKILTQEAVNALIGVDPQSFLNSILFGQRMSRLVTQDNNDKRKLFETLFATEWVANAKLKCDLDIKKFEGEISSTDGDIQKANYMIEQKCLSLDQATMMLNSYEEGRANRILMKENDLDKQNTYLINCTAGIKTINKDIGVLNYDPATHDHVEDEYNTIKNDMQQAEIYRLGNQNLQKQDQMRLETIQKDLARAEAELKKKEAVKIEGDCPYCAQELKPGNKLEANHKGELKTYKETVKVAKAALKAFELELGTRNYLQDNTAPDKMVQEKDRLYKLLVTYSDLEKKYNALWVDLDAHNNNILQAKKDIIRISNEIEAIKAERPPVIDMKKLEVEIKEQQDKLITLQQDKLDIQHDLEIARWWSSKALGAGGLKAYVFTSMLNTLNQCAKKYGQILGISLEFSIDLSKASKPFVTKCSIGEKIDKDYKDLSGGEKQRLDMCLMFALYDVISMGTDINLLIMDEALENLDESGEEAAFNIIRTIADKGKSIYLISHSQSLDSLYSNTIQISKDSNGNTLILE
jgi:RecF/RecN/SMC N terminal domain.